MKVAYIGLGSMGGPQARLIARGDLELSVYDPYPPAIEKFSDIARLATSPADAARDAEIASVCVRDDQQVLDVVLGQNGLIEGLAEGSLLLIHSTITIQTLRDLKARLDERGIALVDAPVSRTRREDDEPFVFTMMGGESADVERARPVVETFSTDADHIGPLGAGMATKISNNLVTWVQIAIGVQATNLAAHYHVPYEKLRGVMKQNGNLTPTMEAMLDGKTRINPGENPQVDEFQASQAGIGEKDLSLAIDSGEAMEMDMALAAVTRDLIRSVMTQAIVKPRT